MRCARVAAALLSRVQRTTARRTRDCANMKNTSTINIAKTTPVRFRMSAASQLPPSRAPPPPPRLASWLGELDHDGSPADHVGTDDSGPLRTVRKAPMLACTPGAPPLPPAAAGSRCRVDGTSIGDGMSAKLDGCTSRRAVTIAQPGEYMPVQHRGGYFHERTRHCEAHGSSTTHLWPDCRVNRSVCLKMVTTNGRRAVWREQHCRARWAARR